MTRRFSVLVLIAAIVGLASAQTYRCDWSVVGIGGGEMSSSAYWCAATAGQTAAGQLTGADYRVLSGFWQADVQVGIREESQRPERGLLVTRLHAPQPNPFRSRVVIRYSLAAAGPATLRIYDQTGRAVREFPVLSAGRGAYSITWDGRDNRGCLLAGGVYYCRLQAGDYRRSEKLLLMR